VQSKEHLNHKLLDKHDYVQNTDVIVDTLFSDFKGLLSELSVDKEAEIQQYKDKIDKEIFPYLFQQLNDVKNKVFKIMNIFIDNINYNKKILFDNVELLKKHSYDGIEDLKKKLKIEDIMVDEEIFLAFDEKIKEISTEKMRILKDSKKYEELLKVISYLSSNIDNIYDEILDNFDKKLKSNIQEKLNEKLSENLITSITRDEIDTILFSDLKKPRRSKIDFPQPKRADFLSGLFSNKNNGVSGNLTNFFSDLKKENFKVPSETHSLSTSPIKENGKGRIENLEPPQDQPKEMLIREEPILQQREQPVEQKKEIVNKISHPEESIYYCKPDSRKILVYDDVVEEFFEQDINVRQIVSFNNFLPGCSWVNSKGQLYISGGFSGEQISNQSYRYDGKSNYLLVLPNMKNSRANHSSILFNDIVYVSGGRGNKTIDCFDTRQYKWSVLGNMAVERESPALFIHGNYLYSFFGIKRDIPIDSIERIKLSGSSSSEIVSYTKDGEFDLKVYGAGVIDMKDSILIVGGKYKDSFNRDNIFHYEFKDSKFDCFEFDIKSDVIFVESTLFKLKDGHFSNFNKIDLEPFKIEIDS